MKHQPEAIAWDIETAPQPLSALTDRQRRRLKKEYAALSRREPEKSVTDLVRKAMSFHGFLCWICCISFAFRDEDDEVRVFSKTASRPVEEQALLSWTWRLVERNRKSMKNVDQFVTFNGKKFDSRILRTRSISNGVFISNTDLLDEDPYSYSPHCDVASMWREDWVGLADAADLCGYHYDSPIMGGDVAEAVVNGRLDLVEEHCEADVRATLRVFEHVRRFNPELR